MEAQVNGSEAHEKRKQKGAYQHFTQFNDRQLNNIRRMTKENPVAAEIFWFLVEHMSRETNAVCCSQKLLQKVVGKGRTTVYQAISYLKEKQFIGIKSVGSSNVYHVNAAVVWHSHGDRLHFAELHAAVLLDPEENPSLKVKQGRINVIEQMELPI